MIIFDLAQKYGRYSHYPIRAGPDVFLEERAFDPLPERVFVPAASLDTYKAAPVWKTFADRMQAL